MEDIEDIRLSIRQINADLASKLKNRSRLGENQPAYIPDGVVIDGRSGISFLDYSLELQDIHQGRLGRYLYAGHRPFTRGLSVEAGARRDVSDDYLPLDIDLGPQLVEFYLGILPRLCQPGNNPGKYGQSVFADAEILYCMYDRILIGRDVARSKVAEDPGLIELVDSPEDLKTALRNEKVERKALARAGRTARSLKFDPAVAKDVIRWLMDQTLQLEVIYIQKMAELETDDN